MTRPLFALVLLALTSLASTAAPVVNVLEGKVVGVTDGDSIKVLEPARSKESPPTEHTIRLAGIDAPEKDQPFGQRSKQSLSNAVMGKDVRIEWSKQDRWNRKVGKVWVTPVSHPCASKGEPGPKTLDVNLAQLTVGLAWHYKEYQKEQSEEDRHRYAFAEQEARARKAGLWSEPDPTAPWDYRHGTAGGPIKKANKSGICHVPGTPGYSATKKFSQYPSLDACLASGGRLSKK